MLEKSIEILHLVLFFEIFVRFMFVAYGLLKTVKINYIYNNKYDESLLLRKLKDLDVIFTSLPILKIGYNLIGMILAFCCLMILFKGNIFLSILVFVIVCVCGFSSPLIVVILDIFSGRGFLLLILVLIYYGVALLFLFCYSKCMAKDLFIESSSLYDTMSNLFNILS